MTIIEAIQDDALFAPWFKARDTWRAWMAFLAALFGLGLTDEERAIYAECTARVTAPSEAAREAWLIIGRRGGKSFIMALVAVFLAAFRDYSAYLAPGERATVLVIAADRKQARVILRYVRGLLHNIPMLAKMIERETTEAFDLTNSTTIEVATGNYRLVRGYTLAAALCDEIAFWRSDDSASPDREVLDALRPAMLTIPNAMLICASSPYSRRGVLWEARCRHFGQDGPILVWQAPTRVMNPTVSQAEIDRKYEEDPSVAAAEYGAQFRSDLQSYVDREAVEACVDLGIRERPYERRWRYVAFTDPSGGSVDAMTLAIAHKEAKTVVLDAVREVRPPFSPESVVEEFAALLRAYHVTKVHGDRYGGEWPREQFRERGITYEPSAKVRSDIYRDTLPLINSRSVGLLDHPKLIAQLVGLERRTGGRGKDAIDHAPGAHDDIANAACGALERAWATEGRSEQAYLAGRPDLPRPPIADPLADYRGGTRPVWDGLRRRA